MRSQAVKRKFLIAQAASSERRAVTRASEFAVSTDKLRIFAIFALPGIWQQRARFRARLRADMKDNADFLHDIGIRVHEAQAEASRFFWEPIKLKRR
jgi:uncharacterized protein YjiS (DUF1127 family)